MTSIPDSILPSQNSVDTNFHDMLDQSIENNSKATKNLKSLLHEAKKSFDQVDKILLEHAKKWLEHLEEFIKELDKEFADNGIPLTAEEKAELRNGAKTISEIRNKINKLKKLGIDLDDNSADYIVKTYDAVVTVLSRTLQKIDSKIVKGLVNKIQLLHKEKSVVKQLCAEQAKQYSEVIAAVGKIEIEIKKNRTLPESFMKTLEERTETFERPAVKQMAPDLKSILE